jgi:hypothetical protein
MKSSTQIIAGGGWMTRQMVGKPRARFFGFLSVIWLAVTIGASFPFWDGWPDSFGSGERLCSVLLVLHLVFIVLALVFLLTERPRRFAEHLPNSPRDLRKMY